MIGSIAHLRMNLFYIHGHSDINQSMRPIVQIHSNGTFQTWQHEIPFQKEFEEDQVLGEIIFENLKIIPYLNTEIYRHEK